MLRRLALNLLEELGQKSRPMGKELETKAEESKENWNPRLPLTAFNHTALVTRERSGCPSPSSTYLPEPEEAEGEVVGAGGDTVTAEA